MDLEKTREEKEKKQNNRRSSPWRKSVVPLSLSLRSRSPIKRESIINVIDDPEPELTCQPTCQEKAHYPVFNPQDPLHTPSAEPRFWRRLDSQSSSSEAQKQGTNWVQGLPRRSLHKARSGLLALRAGWMRRSTRHGSDSDGASPESPRALEPQEEKRGHSARGMSDTSTQADSSMGVRLYRTSTPWPSGATGATSEVPTKSASTHEIMEMVATSGALMSYDDLHNARPAAAYPMNGPSGKPPAYCANYDRASAQRSPKYFQTDGAGHRYTWEQPGESASQHMGESLHHPDNSAVLQMLTSPQKSASPRKEENAGPCGLCNSNSAFSERQDLVPAVHGGDLVVSEVCSSHGRRLSSHIGDASDIRSATVDQDSASASVESFSLPDPDAPSITGTNRSNQQIASIRKSEALVTQERLQTYIEPQRPETGGSSHSHSTSGSAKVGIAFPGIYQELLAQWENETDKTPIRNEGGQKAFVNSQRPSSQTPLQQDMEMQPAVSTKLSRCRDEYHQSGDTHTSHDQQARNVISMYALGQPTVLSSRTTRLGNSRPSQFTSCGSTRSPQGMAHSHPPTEVAAETHHSFGLHISLRNGTAERDGSRERSHRTFQRQSVHQQPPNDRWFMSSAGLTSPFDESSSSSSLTGNSIFSAAANSTSTSNTPWSPLDSPIDEEVLFSNNWRNEYYMADGKTSGYYPDRGDQPVKAMWRRVEDDGRLCSGPGMDWTPSNRLPHASELMIPTRPSRPSRLSSQGGRGRERETVDDYFQRSHAQARRLGG